MATEIEIKRVLDAAGYARLQAHLDTLASPRRHEQVNHYLDLADAALNKAGAMLRLRVVGDRLVLTLKARSSVSDGVLRTQELEQELTTEEDKAFWQQLPVAWQQAAIRLGDWLDTTGLHAVGTHDGTLVEIGQTLNLRLAYKLPKGIPGWPHALTLELDHTQFPGGVERLELELEHPDAAELAPVLNAWLTGLDVATSPATETKYAQFLRLAGLKTTNAAPL